jgi:hypothetical protein
MPQRQKNEKTQQKTDKRKGDWPDKGRGENKAFRGFPATN